MLLDPKDEVLMQPKRDAPVGSSIFPEHLILIAFWMASIIGGIRAVFTLL